MDWIDIKMSKPKRGQKIWASNFQGEAVLGYAYFDIIDEVWRLKNSNGSIRMLLSKWATYDVVY